LKRIGVSADTTLSNVYLFEGSDRLTNSASVSSGYVTFVNSAGIISLEPGESKTVTVKSTIDEDSSGQTVGVEINSATDLASDASSVSDGFPISGNLMSIATASLAEADFTGTPSPLDTTIDPQDDYRVWEDRIQISTREVELNRLSLRQTGSIDNDDLENFRLYVDGTLVDTVESLGDDDHVTFDTSGSPVELDTGTRRIKVLADVIGGSNSDFQFSLRRSVDINLVDSQYGVEILPESFSARETGTIEISTGTVTITKTSDSPSGNVVQDANNQLLGEFEVKAAGETVKIEDLKLSITTTLDSGDEEDFSLRNGYLEADGTQVGSTAAINSDEGSATSTEYTVNMTVEPGSPKTLSVYADIYDEGNAASLTAGDDIQVNIEPSTTNAEGLTSAQWIDVPGNKVSGRELSVTTGEMTLSKSASYPSQDIVTPITEKKLAQFRLTGSSAEAIDLTDIDLEFVVTGGIDATELSDVYVVYGDEETQTKTSVPADGELSWGIDYELGEGENALVEVYGTISDSFDSNETIRTDLKLTGITVDSGDTIYTGDDADDYEPGQTMTLSTGTFAVSLDSDTPSKQLVKGDQTVETAKYKFTAASDTYDVEELIVVVDETDAENVVEAVELYDGTELLKTAYLDSSQKAAFTGLDVEVPADTEKVLTVKLDLSEVSANYDRSGVNVKTDLEDESVKYVDSNGSSESDEPDGDVEGKDIYVYKSVPTVEKIDLAGDFSNGSTLELYEFELTAGDGGGVGLYQFVYDLNWSTATGNSMELSDLKLYEGSNEHDEYTLTDASDAEIDTVDTDDETLTVTIDNGDTIGSSENYTLKGVASGFGKDENEVPDVVSISLAEDDGYVASNEADSTGKNFVWSDLSASSHSITTEDWTGGYLLDIPTDTEAWGY
jgi:hypothetical protein